MQEECLLSIDAPAPAFASKDTLKEKTNFPVGSTYRNGLFLAYEYKLHSSGLKKQELGLKIIYSSGLMKAPRSGA